MDKVVLQFPRAADRKRMKKDVKTRLWSPRDGNDGGGRRPRRRPPFYLDLNTKEPKGIQHLLPRFAILDRIPLDPQNVLFKLLAPRLEEAANGSASMIRHDEDPGAEKGDTP